ncbi:MAG TPA: hypothetical protein PLZ15_01720 [Melioribacteraceae bacterium]|nr:hypothetical protein [Melioribacteraceae bacterium]
MRLINNKSGKLSLYFINFILVSLLFSTELISQEKRNFGISFEGYVRTDFIYDSREVLNLREGHFLFFPLEEKKDSEGRVINDRPSLNMLAIQTRLAGKITAPDFLDAKTSGMIEAEFFGHSDGDINGFRLRHAFVKMEWQKSSLLIGQFWHPMFVAEVFPDVVSFNTGAPFQPFSRNPQFRFTQSLGSLNLIAVAYSQRDFSNIGPSGTSSIYLRNAALPGIHLQTLIRLNNLILGFGGDVKTIKPKTVTEKNIFTDETITSFSGIAYAKYTSSNFSAKLEGVIGQNTTDLMMLGGFGVYDKSAATGIEKYSALNSFSIWSDFSFGKEIQFGLFAGYSGNLGSDKTVISNFARGFNIDYLYRVSPRIIYNNGKIRIAGELEYTSAAYGTPDSKGKFVDSDEVGNLRLLGAVYLFF